MRKKQHLCCPVVTELGGLVGGSVEKSFRALQCNFAKIRRQHRGKEQIHTLADFRTNTRLAQPQAGTASRA